MSEDVVNSSESQTMTYLATPLGARISELYLNPLSGRILRDGLGRQCRCYLDVMNSYRFRP